jgi:hypothetical protein
MFLPVLNRAWLHWPHVGLGCLMMRTTTGLWTWGEHMLLGFVEIQRWQINPV